MAHKVYMAGDQGPFRCSNCQYYPSPHRCNNKKIITFAMDGKFGLGYDANHHLAVVDPDGCSDEYESK